jgi:hypothetical protein
MKTTITFSLATILLLSSCTLLHITPSTKVETIAFDSSAKNDHYKFIYQTLENSPELAILKNDYKIDSVAQKGTTELKKQLALLAWTNSRWQHNGSNEPSKSDALTILKEAQAGNKFRCVEYGIVLRSVLAAAGFNARTLALKTKDVEITKFSAGHVLTEAWSNTYQKWFLLDGQFNAVPTLNGIPLNAVEFQQAIINKEPFTIINFDGELSNKLKKEYLQFVSPYLYYFDFRFDQRDLPANQRFSFNDKTSLMLVPKGAKQPIIFQRKRKIDYCEYTHSLADFYRKP